MTVFFFVVGLEIRREIYEGELSNLRRAAIPLVAALGGMAVPAGLYALLNLGRAGSGGWAIPMATDIAFAVGILALLAARAPSSLRILLLSLAVIDDIGAIIVIAVFYSAGVELAGLAIAAGGMIAVVALRSAAIRSPFVYLVPGVVVWAGLDHAGIHPTLAGVLLGLATPVRAWFGASGFSKTTQAHLGDLETSGSHELLHSLDKIEHARREAVSPVERLVHVLHPWVSYVVMPVFALANAGIPLGDAKPTGDATWVMIGIIVGLVVGKPLGIVAAIVGVRRTGVVPRTHSVRSLLVVGAVGGVGFTMSLFIAQLAFPSGPLLEIAKLGILIGSALAIVVTLALGFTLARTPPAASAADRT